MATVKRISSYDLRRRTVGSKGQTKQGQAAEALSLVRSWRAPSTTIVFGLVCLFSSPLFAQTIRDAGQPPSTLPALSPSDRASAAAQDAARAQAQAAQAQASGSQGSPAAQAQAGGNANAANTDPADTRSVAEKEAAQKAEADKKAAEEAAAVADKLTLADVIASLYRSFPLIEQARLERARTQGMITEAFGAYDTKLQGYSLSEPVGFYNNYRNGIGLARQTWWGGYLSAGYRIGRGEFQPWYKERETNEAGEYKLGMMFPLLQGRAIDPQRVAVFQASLANQAAEPTIQQAILFNSRDAAAIYWEWLAAGSVLVAQRELLAIAEQRGEQYEIGVKAGKFAEIDLIFNQQLIAERKVKVFETEQKYRATSFKLSLFLRNEVGQPMVPADAWLPTLFPDIEPLPEGNYQEDLAAALSRRPEPRLMQLELRQIQLEQQLAQNQLLPALDVVAEASQDTGIPASSSNDKGDFEMMVGVQGEVPLQRRKARGKIQSTAAKIAQITQKLRLQQDKIGAELQTAYNALSLFDQAVDQSEAALRAAVDTLDRYRFAFDRGKVDLIYLTFLETKATETEIKLVEAQQNWFTALAEMQLALGLDPLDQAILISQLPASKRPGPGQLPQPARVNPEVLDQDWEKHEIKP